jgi:hypothetical protein
VMSSIAYRNPHPTYTTYPTDPYTYTYPTYTYTDPTYTYPTYPTDPYTYTYEGIPVFSTFSSFSSFSALSEEDLALRRIQTVKVLLKHGAVVDAPSTASIYYTYTDYDCSYSYYDNCCRYSTYSTYRRELPIGTITPTY